MDDGKPPPCSPPPDRKTLGPLPTELGHLVLLFHQPHGEPWTTVSHRLVRRRVRRSAGHAAVRILRCLGRPGGAQVAPCPGSDGAARVRVELGARQAMLLCAFFVAWADLAGPRSLPVPALTGWRGRRQRGQFGRAWFRCPRPRPTGRQRGSGRRGAGRRCRCGAAGANGANSGAPGSDALALGQPGGNGGQGDAGAPVGLVGCSPAAGSAVLAGEPGPAVPVGLVGRVGHRWGRRHRWGWWVVRQRRGRRYWRGSRVRRYRWGWWDGFVSTDPGLPHGGLALGGGAGVSEEQEFIGRPSGGAVVASRSLAPIPAYRTVDWP